VACGEGEQSPEGYFRSALSLLPTNANALHLLGITALPHSPQDAVQQFSRSLLLDPDFKGAYANLALAYLRLRSWDRAWKVARAGHERHPNAPQLAYHCAVATCQLALELVDKQVEQTDEYQEVQLAARQAKLDREQLELEAKAAKQDSDEKKKLLDQAVAARDAAREKMLRSDQESTQKGPVAGTKMRCLTNLEVFDGPPYWQPICHLKNRQVVIATGPPFRVDHYRMLPVEPTGYVDIKDLDRVESSSQMTEERKLYKDLQTQRDAAHNQWLEATQKTTEARSLVKKANEESIPTTISRRPVSRILDPELLDKYEGLRRISQEMFDKARSGPLALSRRRGPHCPWTEVDDAMIDAMKSGDGPVVINLPSNLGWPCNQYRL